MAARPRRHVSADLGGTRPRQAAARTRLDLRRSTLGDDHPFYTLRSALSLAFTLRELGQYEQARQLAEDTLTRLRRVLGDDHPYTLRSAHNLATCLNGGPRRVANAELGTEVPRVVPPS